MYILHKTNVINGMIVNSYNAITHINKPLPELTMMIDFTKKREIFFELLLAGSAYHACARMIYYLASVK